MARVNKLNITDSLTKEDGPRIGSIRLRQDLHDWIEENTTGSQNSVINFLINIGVNNIEGILEHDSIYETVNKDHKSED